MEKEVFYVRSGDISLSSSPQDLTYTISIDAINALALFATALEPESEITAATGHASALNTYFENHSDNIYNDCYEKLISSNYGRQFLCTTISLFLLEKEMRTNGVNEKSIESYSKLVNDYHKQIEFSKPLNNDEQQKKI